MELNTLDALNLELLRTFMVASRTRTFAEAGRLRSVTVSAVSQQVKALEGQLGLQLFERLGRRVKLTPAGRALSLEVSEQLTRLGESIDRARQAHVRVAGTVVLGGPRTFGAYWVTPRLIALARKEPALRVDQRFDVPSSLERQLLDGSVDLAILGRPAEVTGLETVTLTTETFVAVAAPSLLQRLGPARTEAALAAWPWLAFDSDLPMHGPWWRASFGRRARVPSTLVAMIASLEQLEAFATAGLGAVVLPSYVVQASLRAKRLGLVVPKSATRVPRAAHNPLFLAWRRSSVMSARVAAVRAALTS